MSDSSGKDSGSPTRASSERHLRRVPKLEGPGSEQTGPIENGAASGAKVGASGSKTGAPQADLHSNLQGNTSFRSSTLAPVQRQTLEFLRNFIAEKGYAPTLKDISTHIGVKSLSTAHFHLERLVDKGFIRRGSDGMIELVDVAKPELGPTAVPLVGVIAAGMPIEAIEQTTFIDIPPSMIDGRGEVFCLEVSGTSMIDAHICDQDIVVVKKQTNAENGQIVVALLEDGSATLKTYRRLKNGKVMLIPANPALSPITLDSVAIQGRVIGIIRQLH